VGGKYGKNKDEKLSSLYTFGLGFDASEKLLVSAEVQKEEDQPVNVNAGVQYRFLPQFMARVGCSHCHIFFVGRCRIQAKIF
jgi:hypothetical protein